MLEKKITFDSFIRFIFGLSIIIGIILLFDKLSAVLLPFFIAWLIAYFMYPLVCFFQYKLRIRIRVLSILCAILTVAGVITGLSFLLIPPMISEFGKVNNLIMTYISNGSGINVFPKIVTNFINENLDVKELNKIFSEENIANLTKNALPKLWTLLSESLNILFSVIASFIILLYTVFILLDYEAIADGWVELIPNKYRHFASNVVSDLKNGMNRYFRGQAFVALCVAILSSIGFLIIDYPLALGLGLLIGILSMIPYMKVIALFPALILGLLKVADTGDNIWVVLGSALIVFAIVQAVEDSFIVPNVMGRITGLNPAIILLSLSIWGSLLGILGMIIALPTTTLMLSYYRRYVIHREKIIDTKESDYQTERTSKEK
ncbi:AI-2E family transporter [uncultured Bacteroides sp.]|uniref:AI-2E family transporter n=1 Tax=uncultured Bacteroides sp. TaxID=162156 RepID=UPI002AAB4231|nr:AI-2E family transporter [uncultured Bacteroides sp.]